MSLRNGTDNRWNETGVHVYDFGADIPPMASATNRTLGTPHRRSELQRC